MALRSIITSRFIILALGAMLMSCAKTTSEVPAECFRLWSGKQPDAETKIAHAKYWQSGSIVKEYMLFMELQPSAAWQKEFMRENKLVLVDDDDEWTVPDDAPTWFAPAKSYKVLKLPLPYGESRYFIDSLTNHMFIFEIEM
jgi:hypothetical protein